MTNKKRRRYFVPSEQSRHVLFWIHNYENNTTICKLKRNNKLVNLSPYSSQELEYFVKNGSRIEVEEEEFVLLS